MWVPLTGIPFTVRILEPKLEAVRGSGGIRWGSDGIRWDPMGIVPDGFRLRSGQFSRLEEIVGKRDF